MSINIRPGYRKLMPVVDGMVAMKRFLIKVRSLMGLYYRTNLTKEIGVCFSDSLPTVAGFICFSLCSLYCKPNLTTAAQYSFPSAMDE